MTFPRPMHAWALFAVTLSPALADDVRFSYRAHELETPERLEALLERIERTAQRACRTEPVLPPHYGKARYTCETDLITAIISEIDDARLYVAAHHERGVKISDPDGDRIAATE